MTFDGIAKACAAAMGAPEPEIVHYNPKGGLGAARLFRLQAMRRGLGL